MMACLTEMLNARCARAPRTGSGGSVRLLSTMGSGNARPRWLLRGIR